MLQKNKFVSHVIKLGLKQRVFIDVQAAKLKGGARSSQSLTETSDEMLKYRDNGVNFHTVLP